MNILFIGLIALLSIILLNLIIVLIAMITIKNKEPTLNVMDMIYKASSYTLYINLPIFTIIVIMCTLINF